MSILTKPDTTICVCALSESCALHPVKDTPSLEYVTIRVSPEVAAALRETPGFSMGVAGTIMEMEREHSNVTTSPVSPSVEQARTFLSDLREWYAKAGEEPGWPVHDMGTTCMAYELAEAYAYRLIAESREGDMDRYIAARTRRIARGNGGSVPVGRTQGVIP